MSKESPKSEQISIRVDKSQLDELEAVGQQIKPVPVKRNAMIGLAIAEYLERHRPSKRK